MDELTPKATPEDRAIPDLPVSTDRGHDVWVRAKIEAALKEAVDHPNKLVSLDQVWKRFGLEH